MGWRMRRCGSVRWRLLVLALAGVVVAAWQMSYREGVPTETPVSVDVLTAPSTPMTTPPTNTRQPASDSGGVSAGGFVPPLDRANERVTKKPFGIFITPKDSPIQPERFSGYHTGADFEIFPEEFSVRVPAKAVCDGTLLAKQYVSGYGGVVVESCSLKDVPITVVYGHLSLSSITLSVKDTLKAGDVIGDLGADRSVETDGERKHLHVAFHKGTAITLLGYTGTRAQLAQWIDPCQYVCH